MFSLFFPCFRGKNCQRPVRSRLPPPPFSQLYQIFRFAGLASPDRHPAAAGTTSCRGPGCALALRPLHYKCNADTRCDRNGTVGLPGLNHGNGTLTKIRRTSPCHSCRPRYSSLQYETVRCRFGNTTDSEKIQTRLALASGTKPSNCDPGPGHRPPFKYSSALRQ
jgi:hypothetical protein